MTFQRPISIASVVAAILAIAAPANAADRVVTTVARATPVDAFAGRAVWSTWDPAAGAFRLTEYVDGRVQTIPVTPSTRPFDVDLGPGPRGRTLAVYSRCRRPPITSWQLNGRRGCNVYAYDFASGREFPVTGANSVADEYWPTVWRSRIAFTRSYRDGRQLLQWRRLGRAGRSRVLERSRAGVREQADLNGRRVAYVRQFEYGGELRLARIGAGGRRLVRIPGSGAEANTLDAQGPTINGAVVDWALSVGGSAPVYSEIRRNRLTSRRARRAITRIDSDPALPRATEGFAQDRTTSWYVRAASDSAYEIHVASGLTYEPAPPIELD